jgi:hypothetical protein
MRHYKWEKRGDEGRREEGGKGQEKEEEGVRARNKKRSTIH